MGIFWPELIHELTILPIPLSSNDRTNEFEPPPCPNISRTCGSRHCAADDDPVDGLPLSDFTVSNKLMGPHFQVHEPAGQLRARRCCLWLPAKVTGSASLWIYLFLAASCRAKSTCISSLHPLERANP